MSPGFFNCQEDVEDGELSLLNVVPVYEKVIAKALQDASTRKENGFNRRKRKFTGQHWNKKKGSKQKIDVSRLNFLESLKSLLFHE